MSLNLMVSAQRVQIGFFGKRNAGKSSVVNAIAGQEVSLVSDVPGTTTDPVRKVMELNPLGPVVLIDTAGMDDEGELGLRRVEKTKVVTQQVDIAVIVIDSAIEDTQQEWLLAETFLQKQIPCIMVYNKCELRKVDAMIQLSELIERYKDAFISVVKVSTVTGEGIESLKAAIASNGRCLQKDKYLVRDLISPGEHVVLVVPIDEAAPKGRLILPQQLVIRDILDAGAYCSVVKPEGLNDILKAMKEKPGLVITDSQAFAQVDKILSKDIHLTSFSILMARYKGTLTELMAACVVLDSLKNGDKILISEGCTHRRQCGDIGTVKIPNLIKKYTNSEPEFVYTSGMDFPEELSEYRLVIHCGACMLNEKEMQRREQLCREQGVLMTNFGMAIAKMNGILERSTEILIGQDR